MKLRPSVGRHSDARHQLKIAIISRGDATSGGAGRVAQLLAGGLRGAELNVRHIVRLPPAPNYRPSCERLGGIPGDILVRNVIGGDLSGVWLMLKCLHRWADIIHFHDISVAYGISVANWLAFRIPLCITLHDYSLITGGCLFPKICTRFHKGCGHCPQIGHPPLTFPLDTTRLNFRRHKSFFSQKTLTAIAPSEFIRQQAKMGAGSDARIIRLDNPVDTEVFTSAHRAAGRKNLGATDKHKLLLFVATRLDDPRKGLLAFIDTFRALAARYENLRLILVGRFSDPSFRVNIRHDNIHFLGPISDAARLAETYAAADCSVIPSTEDNVPCTLVESLSTGTPVLARRTGGIAEMFENGHQGVLITGHSFAEWESAIQKALFEQQLASRRHIRRYVLSRYGLPTFVNAHVALYRDIMRAHGQ